MKMRGKWGCDPNGRPVVTAPVRVVIQVLLKGLYSST